MPTDDPPGNFRRLIRSLRIRQERDEARAMVRRLIAANLREQWLESGPTEECFDRDDDRMGDLLSFLAGRGTREDRERSRVHLVACPRCRFIYARMREEQADAY